MLSLDSFSPYLKRNNKQLWLFELLIDFKVQIASIHVSFHLWCQLGRQCGSHYKGIVWALGELCSTPNSAV